LIPLKQEPLTKNVPSGVEIVTWHFEESKSPKLVRRKRAGAVKMGENAISQGEKAKDGTSAFEHSVQQGGIGSNLQDTIRVSKNHSVKNLFTTITHTAGHLLKQQKPEPGSVVHQGGESPQRDSMRTPSPELEPLETTRISLTDIRTEHHSPRTPTTNRARSTTIHAPTHLQKASIHSNAQISSNVTIGDNCIIESGVRIFASQRSGGINIGKNNIIKRNAKIINEMPDATLVIGEANVFETEAKVYWCNRRIDHTEQFSMTEIQSGVIRIGDQNVFGMRSSTYCSVGSYCCVAARAEVLCDINDHGSVWTNGTCFPVRQPGPPGNSLFKRLIDEDDNRQQRDSSGPFIIHRTNPSHFEQLEILQRQMSQVGDSAH